MVQRWTITYGTFTFETTTRFSLRSQLNFGEDGKIEDVETLVALEGTLVGAAPDPAASATDKHIALRALQKLPDSQRLTLKLDGTTKYDFLPNSFGTPRLREITEIPHGASHGTHVKYALSFYVREAATGKEAFVVELDSSAEFYLRPKEDDKLVQQIWHVKTKGKTLKAAQDLALTFKPAGIKPLTERLHQSPKTNTFEATWIYDKTKGDGILSILETVRIENSGHPIGIMTRTGKNVKPALHRRKFTPGFAEITFTVEATDAALIARPDAHFTENGDLTRDRTREPIDDPVQFDSIRGLYRGTFREFWIYTGTTRPDPQHKADHDKPFPERSDVPKIKDGVDW